MGLHCGRVTTGEIGVIKKDIVYSGDVLNTTSRIQSLCNELGVKILLSKKLLDLLHLPPHSLQPKKMGDIDLKGNIAIVLGSEGAGLRQKTRENCDFLATIPAPLADLSLNVSVATGICLYEINRQRSS